MGFMDKAKKLAEQAQAKLDEVQKDFNEKQASGASAGAGPAVEYDKHGRPVTPPEDRLVPEPGPSHTQGDPADDFPSTAPAPTPPGDPLGEPPQAQGGAAKDQGDPLGDQPPADKSPTFPPKEQPGPGPAPGMTSGDPLAG